MSYWNLEQYAASQAYTRDQADKQKLEMDALYNQASHPYGVAGSSSASSSSGSYSGSMGVPSASYVPQFGSVDTNQATYDPWSAHRAEAGNLLASGSFGTANDPSNFYADKLKAMSEGQFSPADPSYQWRLDQGQQALERSLAAKGLLNSGNAAIELQQYGQGAASQEYGAQFDRMLKAMTGVSQVYDQQQQRLMAMAGVNLDPTAGAKLGIMQQQANTDAQQVANQYTVGMTNAANTIRAAQIGAAAGNANAATNAQLQSYQMAQNNAAQDAISSDLFFGRDNGLSSGANFYQMWSTGAALG